MQRSGALFVAIIVSLLIVVAGLLHALRQQPPYAPQVNAERPIHGAPKGEGHTNTVNPRAAKPNAEHDEQPTERSDEEGTEFWPTFLGLHLKITDSLLAAFTLGLFIFTGLLWRSTDKLWQAGERQLISTQRAYVRVLQYPWLWRGDNGRPGKFFYDITPIIENGGNTQTVDAKINVNFALRDEPLPENFDFPYFTQPGLTLIGAHQTVGASNAHILDDDLLSVQNGHKHFYIWGTVTYRDVFPDTPERVTEFCTEISRVFGDPLDPREPGNPKGTTVEISFRIYPEHQKTT